LSHEPRRMSLRAFVVRGATKKNNRLVIFIDTKSHFITICESKKEITKKIQKKT